MIKKILYIDMDGVIVDFGSGLNHISINKDTLQEYEGRFDEIPGIFGKMKPLENSIEVINELGKYYDIFFLSTAPWENPTAWSDKLIWIKKYFNNDFKKRLILTHNKHLNKGDILIDDRKANGSDKFEGQMIHFGTEGFENWNKIKEYLISIL